jgi:phosphoglycolate phosphatase-like HAD superfamily hydrolase
VTDASAGSAQAVRRLFDTAAAIVFDFDGTLVDSNEIKWRAFETVFSDYPEHMAEISAYCRANNHTPRWVKFRHVYEQILRAPYTVEAERRIHERFEEETTAAIVAAPEIPGASACLASLAPRVRLGLLSSTPTAILAHLAAARGWTDRFTWMQGAPIDKRQWLASLTADLGVPAETVVFCGDTPEDRGAAAGARCTFVGVRDRALAGAADYWIEDFTCLT